MQKDYTIKLHEDRRGFWVAEVLEFPELTCRELDISDALEVIGFMLWQRRQELSIK